MAFVQQGPRRTRSHREHPSADATPSTSISQLPASSSYQSAATRATDTASTSKHHHTSHASHATDDWSIIFPGRENTRKVDQKLDAGQDPPQATTTASHIFTSQHDGTESFETYDLDFPADISSGHPSSPLVHRETLFREHSSDSATSQVPSMLLSGHALHPPTFSVSQRSSSTSRSALLSPSSALIFGDEDDVVSNASWDLSEQQDQPGPAQLTSSSIDLQQSMERAQRPVIYATDSESEEEVVDIANEASPSRPPRRRRDSEARFEEALAATPFAQSAGLHPRRSLRPRSSLIAATDDSASVLSGRSSALSAGLKRRHRRQLLADEQRSARSNKSRRSEAVVDHHALESSSKATEAERQAKRLASKGKSRAEDQIHPAVKPVTRSKAARMAKLLGKMFDVDDDVMDALMEDKGPLAPVKEADPSAMPSRLQLGFEHDAAELNGSAGPKKWRELIDGRIVEDDEDSEQEHHIASTANDQEEADIDRALSWMTSPPTSGEADSSRLDTPTLRDALQHTFSRIAGGPSAALFSSGQYQQLQHQHHLPLTNAVVRSMSDGIANALPYFIPFSWRMLMRLMNQWNQEQQGQQQGPAFDEAKDQQPDGDKEDTAQEEGDHQQDAHSAKSSESSNRSSDRGRDQQIKKLGLSIDSDWTSPSGI